jgi:GxxExxY protein
MQAKITKHDLVYPELSYRIVGCAFSVYNEIGFGHPEKYYQKAFAIALTNSQIKYKEQAYHNLKFQGKIIGKQFFDFLIEDKIIVELKRDVRFSKQHMDQVNNYLRVSNLQLALLINFSKDGVIYKRMLNIIQNQNHS